MEIKASRGGLITIAVCYIAIIVLLFVDDDLKFEFNPIALPFAAIILILVIILMARLSRIFTFSSDGIEVRIWFYKRFYHWDELVVKRIEAFKTIAKDQPYRKGAVFRCKPITRDDLRPPLKIMKCITYYDYCLDASLFLTHDIIFVNFNDDAVRHTFEAFEIDENTFRENMNKWGIRLEEVSWDGTVIS